TKPDRVSRTSTLQSTDNAEPSRAVDGKTHRVKAGETLGKIAAMHGVSVDDLETANQLKNIGALRVGQELKIPSKTNAKTSEKLTDSATKKPGEPAAKLVSAGSAIPKDSGEVYTVARGESPVAIAKKLGV